MKPLPPMSAHERACVRMVVRRHPGFAKYLKDHGYESRELNRPMVSDFLAWLNECPVIWGSGGDLSRVLHQTIRNERRRQQAIQKLKGERA